MNCPACHREIGYHAPDRNGNIFIKCPTTGRVGEINVPGSSKPRPPEEEDREKSRKPKSKDRR